MPIPQLEKKKKKLKPKSTLKEKIKLPAKLRKLKPWLRKLLIILAIACGLGLIFTLGTFAYLSRQLPDPDRISEIVPVNSVKFYDRTGQTLLFEKGDVIQQAVDYTKVPNNLKYATLALEDKNFYEHHGFSVIGVARAIFNNVLGRTGYTSGGSTLTQQLIKNTIVGTEKTYTRKAKELILSIEMERRFSKDQILELYFNRVYYGRFHMGVASAARDFFGKEIDQLTLAECATLASIPRNPPYYLSDPDKLKTRRDYALDVMVEEGYLTSAEAEQAKAEPIAEITESTTNIIAPHFVFYVNDLLTDEYGAGFLQNSGLKVTTTLDLSKQEKAEQAIADGLPKIEQYGGSNAGLVSIDAHTGQIVAMVGSKNFFAEDYDGQVNVTTSLRQPGSSFKPVVYLTAFSKGYLPQTKVWDVETDFVTDSGNYHPRNFDLGQRGLLTLRTALSNSLNIPAVKVLYLVGLDPVLDQAEALGYTSFTDRSRFGLALTLGGGEVQLLEHTSAFATFAREGERHPVAAILKVEDQTGKVLSEWQDEPEQVADQQAVRLLNDVLSDQAARGSTFSRLNLADRPSAGKTGTTNDFRDAWTIGYTPSLATGVWVGNNDNTEMNRMADGIIIAAPIWNQYMTAVLEGTPVETFNEPDQPKSSNQALLGNIEEKITKKVDSQTGKIVPEECLSTYPTEYLIDKEFKQGHTILYYLNKNDLSAGPPADPTADPQYLSWENAVQKYLENQPDYLPIDEEKIQYEDCSLRDPAKAPTVKILSPEAAWEYSKKDLLLQARVTPGEGRSVVKVDFMIDVITVDSQSYTANVKTTFTSTYSPTSLTDGQHTLTVTATDNRGSQTQAQTTFNYTAKKKN